MKLIASFIGGVLIGAIIAERFLPTNEEPLPDPIWCYQGTYPSIEEYPDFDNVRIIPKGNSLRGAVDVFIKCAEQN